MVFFTGIIRDCWLPWLINSLCGIIQWYWSWYLVTNPYGILHRQYTWLLIALINNLLYCSVALVLVPRDQSHRHYTWLSWFPWLINSLCGIFQWHWSWYLLSNLYGMLHRHSTWLLISLINKQSPWYISVVLTDPCTSWAISIVFFTSIARDCWLLRLINSPCGSSVVPRDQSLWYSSQALHATVDCLD